MAEAVAVLVALRQGMRASCIALLLLIGLSVPVEAAATPRTAASQARVVPFKISPDRAEQDLERLNTAGVHTLADLARAPLRTVAAIVGTPRATELRAAATRYLAPDSMVDPKTPLAVPFIIEPSFIVDPILRTDAASRKKLAVAKARTAALAKVGIRTYVDLVNADPSTVTGAVGKVGIWLQSEARQLAESAGIILHNDKIILQRSGTDKASDSKSSLAIIDPTYRTGIVDPAYTAMITETGFRRGLIDPTYLSSVIEPDFLVDPSILSDPAGSR